MKPRKRIAALAVTAATVGGLASISAGVFAASASSTTSTPPTTLVSGDQSTTPADPAVAPDQYPAFATAALDGLVANGTLTHAQADAVEAALLAARPARDGDRAAQPGGPDGNGQHAPGGGQRASLVDRQAVDTMVTSLTGISVDGLHTALQSGSTLAEIAGAHGVSEDQLVTALVAQVDKAAADAVTAGTITQDEADVITSDAAEHITVMVTSNRPEFANCHGGPRGHAPDRAAAPASTTSGTPAS